MSLRLSDHSRAMTREKSPPPLPARNTDREPPDSTIMDDEAPSNTPVSTLTNPQEDADRVSRSR